MKENQAAHQDSPLLESLLQSLRLLIAQAEMYERILPVGVYPARAAVAVLSELAREALNEAQTVAESLAPREVADHPFSQRELQVLGLAARGMTNKEIAYRLRISERTVQFHINSIFTKTGTSTRTEIVAQAIRNRWVDLESD